VLYSQKNSDTFFEANAMDAHLVNHLAYILIAGQSLVE